MDIFKCFMNHFIVKFLLGTIGTFSLCHLPIRNFSEEREGEAGGKLSISYHKPWFVHVK